MVSSTRAAMPGAAAQVGPSAPRIKNPHLATTATPAADSVVLSTPPTLQAPPSPTAAMSGADGKAMVAAGVVAAVVAGIMLPIVGNVVAQISPPSPAASVSQTLTLGAQGAPGVAMSSPNAASTALQQIEHPASTVQQSSLDQLIQDFITKVAQDPSTGFKPSGSPQKDINEAISRAALSASNQMLDVNKTHQGWSSDVAAMQQTYQDLFSHDDAIMRGNGDTAAHHAAIDKALAQITQQFAAFQKRLQTEQPAVDQRLAPIRDTLNEAGVIEFNLQQRVDRTASQYGAMQPQRQMLARVSVQLHSGSIDLAMATERTTAARNDDKTLVASLQAVGQLIDQVNKANEAAKKDPSAMSQVDTATTALGTAVAALKTATDQNQQDLQAASARAQHVPLDNGMGGLTLN